MALEVSAYGDNQPADTNTSSGYLFNQIGTPTREVSINGLSRSPRQSGIEGSPGAAAAVHNSAPWHIRLFDRISSSVFGNCRHIAPNGFQRPPEIC